ncbi:MAG: glutamate--cysteine ligase [Alteromonadaceae bacterium]|nr:glutamate--cysteine ligase [Alteromonadaceae bacterium]
MAELRLQRFQELIAEQWPGFLKGVEREGLRVDRNGFIAQTPHPVALGSALTHPRITTDYSEALLELITPVCDSTESLLHSLRQIHSYVQLNLGDELFWPNSMPCRIDGDASIPIAEYGTSNVGRLKYVYRQGLAVRYGRVMQSIAGTHYNFSLPDAFWKQWQRLAADGQTLQDFKSEQYFWLIRNFRRRSWLVMYLFGSSPALDASFVAGRPHNLKRWDDQTWYSPKATSLRMGDLGYHNNAQASLNICFNRLDTYIETLERAIHTPWPAYEAIGLWRNGEPIQINTNVLQIENEYYSAMRPKRTTQSGEKPSHALRARGVEYVEVRCLDLDPFAEVGISAAQVDFLDLFLLDCLLSESPAIDPRECDVLDNNFREVVNEGRRADLSLEVNKESHSLRDCGARIFDRLVPLAELLDRSSGRQQYTRALAVQRAKLDDDSQTASARALAAMESQGVGYLEWSLGLAENQQRALREEGLTVSEMEAERAAAEASLAATRQLEAEDGADFEAFLAHYRAQ